MRRASIRLAIAVLFVLCAAPAHAWWGWLDDLSGPGPFSGWMYEFRVVCFGPKSAVDDLLMMMAAFNEAETKSPADPATKRRRGEEVRDRLISANAQFPLLSKATLKDLTADTFFANTDYADELRTQVANFVFGVSAIGSVGTFLSACPLSVIRHSSIEVGVNEWSASGVDTFANSQEVRLTMLMPKFSFRLFTDPHYDVLDAGFGAGVYWFSSAGFDSFTGLVVEPGYVDLHPPTILWRSQKKGLPALLQRIAAMPTFRIGAMVFPSGFGADAFAGKGDHHVRVAAELLPTWSLFFNFEPLLRQSSLTRRQAKKP